MVNLCEIFSQNAIIIWNNHLHCSCNIFILHTSCRTLFTYASSMKTNLLLRSRLIYLDTNLFSTDFFFFFFLHSWISITHKAWAFLVIFWRSNPYYWANSKYQFNTSHLCLEPLCCHPTKKKFADFFTTYRHLFMWHHLLIVFL